MFEDKVIVSIMSFLLVMVLIGVGYSIVEAKWDSQCKSAGYREVQVAWFFTPYCITRSDQTDLVVPLREVRP